MSASIRSLRCSRWRPSAPTSPRGSSARPNSMGAAFVAIVLGAALSAACDQSPAGGPAAVTANEAAPVPASTPGAGVSTVRPQYKTRVDVLQTSGKIQFNEEALVRVHAPATGRVLEVVARPGDVVEPGARLLLLDSADLGSAKADYAKAVSDTERANAALALARELYEVKAVARKEIREAENDARK